MERTGLPSVAAVDVGLRTSILGLKEEFSNREYAAKLEALVESNKILLPDEGRFSDLLHDQVLSSTQLLGYEWVWVGDEFGTERKLYWIDDLKNQESGPTVGHCNVFTPNKALLWATHWDSHFSFLCSSERNLNAILKAYHFEGFSAIERRRFIGASGLSEPEQLAAASGKTVVPILCRMLDFHAFEDFRDVVESISSARRKTCQECGSNPCRGAKRSPIKLTHYYTEK
jgi:hypothetical protein